MITVDCRKKSCLLRLLALFSINKANVNNRFDKNVYTCKKKDALQLHFNICIRAHTHCIFVHMLIMFQKLCAFGIFLATATGGPANANVKTAREGSR